MKTLHTVYSYDLNEKIKFMKKMVKTLLMPEHVYKYEYFFSQYVVLDRSIPESEHCNILSSLASILC